eukprot:31139-Pelagococcus_subviridis.AAC.12
MQTYGVPAAAFLPNPPKNARVVTTPGRPPSCARVVFVAARSAVPRRATPDARCVVFADSVKADIIYVRRRVL